MTHPNSTLALLEGMAERLKLRYGCLDSVGVAGSGGHVPQALTTRISTVNAPTPLITLSNPDPSAGRMQLQQQQQHQQQQQQRMAAASALRALHSKTAASTFNSGGSPTDVAGRDDPAPNSAAHVDPLSFHVSNTADRRQLVAQVMRDFGYAFGGARGDVRNDAAVANAQRHPHAGARTVHVGEHECVRPSAVSCGDGTASSLLSTAEPVSRIHGSAMTDLLSANGVLTPETPSNPAGGATDAQNDDLPRPQTPPRPYHPHQRHVAAGLSQSGPNVLTVGGFDDLGDTVVGAQAARSRGHGESADGGRAAFIATTSEVPGAQQDRHAERQMIVAPLADDIGNSTFSSQAISDLLATSRVGLNASKREELFSLARLAYESIIGPKEQVSPVYRAYGNVARAADKVAGKPIKTVNEIFARIVSHTADRHRRGELVANERVLHHSLVVPGGCSSIAAEVVSKRGLRTNLLRVIPATAAVARAQSVQQRSGRSRSARQPSPPRWPHRVITMPFVADNLTKTQTRVRHASATRRTDSSRPVGPRISSGTNQRKSLS